MNQMTPIYCHSCTNLQRSHVRADQEYCLHHKRPAMQIVTHCIDVGGKSEKPIFFQKKVR